MTDKKQAVSYSRFSPRPNSAECDSIEKQQWDIKRFAKRNGYEIVAEYSDAALSGADAERPGLWDAINALKRGMTLLIRTWDRLARDSYLGLVIQNDVKKKGCSIVAIEQTDTSKDTPESDLVRTILLALSEYQRQITRARTRAAMHRHQAEGRRMSDRVPFGWKRDPEDDARLVIDDHEQLVIKKIIELKAQGESLRGICKILTAEGYKARMCEKKFKGRDVTVKGIWHHQLIQAVLSRASRQP